MAEEHDAGPEPRTRHAALGCLGWCAGALALHGWRVLEPLGRDQSVFYVLAREAFGGALPYRDLFEHKPPGVLAVFAAAFALDGGAGWGIALLDALAVGLTAWLLTRALTRAGARFAAPWAAIIYLVVARGPAFGGFWATGQPEGFQDLCVAAMLAFGAAGAWAWAGAAVAGALALKFTYVGLVPVLLLWATAVPRATPAATATARAPWVRALAGLAGAGAVMLAALAASGVLAPLYDATITFNLRHAAVEALPWAALPGVLVARALALGSALPAAWLPASVGLFLRTPARWPRWLPAGLVAAALLQLLMQRKLWSWHWMALMAPLSLLAGVALGRAASRSRLLAGVLAAALLAPSLFLLARDAWRRFAPGDERAVLARYTWGKNDFSALEVHALGEAIQKNAKPGDRLLVWGFEPGIYLSSGLRPGTRWLYDYPLTVGMEGAARDAALAELAAALPRTRFVLVMRNDQNALEREDSWAQAVATPVLRDALRRDYRPAGRLFDGELFVRR